jgi:hypothetical protein
MAARKIFVVIFAGVRRPVHQTPVRLGIRRLGRTARRRIFAPHLRIAESAGKNGNPEIKKIRRMQID